MENRLNNDPKSVSENEVVTNRIDNARKEGVTKGALTAGIVGLILVLALGILGYSLHKKDHNNQLALMEDQRVTFTQELTQRDSTLNDWMASFNEIENNLRMIREKEKLISVNSSGAEVSKDKRNQILEDIQSINSLLEDNKKKIAQLNSQLKKSGNTVTELQKKIASLEESMKAYETEIAELKTTLSNKNFEIGQLNETVVALNDTITNKQETISNQTYKLHQAFIVSGTYKDLKAKGLLSKEGGFLGIGRKEAILEDFSDSLFKEIDITQTKTIPVNSKDMKLITEHPSGSYEVVKEGENTVAYIAIKNPDEFWRISKYAVVELKR
jgi:predicted  nucleic acid-binding Zn-ribbon protein